MRHPRTGKKKAKRSTSSRTTSGGSTRRKKIAPAKSGKYLRLVVKNTTAKVEQSNDPSFAKAHKAIRKVNRHAYTFRPDVLLTVGVDVANGRVIVKEVQAASTLARINHYADLMRSLEGAARLYCTRERLRLGVFRRECNHPKHRIKKQRYVHDATVRNGKVIDTHYKHAHFCTRCGTKIKEA